MKKIAVTFAAGMLFGLCACPPQQGHVQDANAVLPPSAPLPAPAPINPNTSPAAHK